MVGHLLWYHPAVLKLKELVEAGELGRASNTFIRTDFIWAGSAEKRTSCGPLPRMTCR